MIKIVDSGYGVRLSFDETEVFNHTSLVPFIKSVKAEKVRREKRETDRAVRRRRGIRAFGRENQVVFGKVRAYRLFGIRRGFCENIRRRRRKTSCAAFSNATFSAAKLTFLVPPTFPVKFCGKEISKGTTDNLVEKRRAFCRQF